MEPASAPPQPRPQPQQQAPAGVAPLAAAQQPNTSVQVALSPELNKFVMAADEKSARMFIRSTDSTKIYTVTVRFHAGLITPEAKRAELEKFKLQEVRKVADCAHELGLGKPKQPGAVKELKEIRFQFDPAGVKIAKSYQKGEQTINKEFKDISHYLGKTKPDNPQRRRALEALRGGLSQNVNRQGNPRSPAPARSGSNPKVLDVSQVNFLNQTIGKIEKNLKSENFKKYGCAKEDLEKVKAYQDALITCRDNPTLKNLLALQEAAENVPNPLKVPVEYQDDQEVKILFKNLNTWIQDTASSVKDMAPSDDIPPFAAENRRPVNPIPPRPAAAGASQRPTAAPRPVAETRVAAPVAPAAQKPLGDVVKQAVRDLRDLGDLSKVINTRANPGLIDNSPFEVEALDSINSFIEALQNYERSPTQSNRNALKDALNGLDDDGEFSKVPLKKNKQMTRQEKALYDWVINTCNELDPILGLII